jgi:hypothetical protein
MPRRPEGQVAVRRNKDTTVYALRFMAYGEPVHHARAADEGWTRQKAERELSHVLADVERGSWVAPGETRATQSSSPDFHEFASEWLEAQAGELRENTILDYTWQLTHLLPFFHRHNLSQITVAGVDRYASTRSRKRSSVRRRSPDWGRSSPSPRSAT